MKSILYREFGGPEKLLYDEIPVPEISEDEVLVKVKATSVNHVDIWSRTGSTYRPLLPHIPGLDLAGVVEKIGKSVKGLKKGDRVFNNHIIHCGKCSYCKAGNDELCDNLKMFGIHTDGAYAEYAKIPTRNLIKIPKNLSFEQAAAFPVVFQTAWHMLLTRAKLKKGETVLILSAASGVGSAGIQIAKLKGAHVIAAAGSDEKLQKAKEWGADDVINYNTENISESVKKITNDRGVDIVFDTVGKDTFSEALNSLVKSGRFMTCGVTSGGDVAINLRHLFSKELSIIGSKGGTMKELREITKHIEKGNLKPIIYKTLKLSEARKAHEMMEARKVIGKIVLVP